MRMHVRMHLLNWVRLRCSLVVKERGLSGEVEKGL